MELYERPNTEVEVDGEQYKIVAYPAMTALDFQFEMSNGMTPKLIRDMILKGVSKNGVAFNNESFDRAFTGKIPHMMKLWEQIVEFNFKDPLDESDSESL